MNEYHKIQTVYKRDPSNNHKTLLEGEFSLPEFEFLADNEWVFTEKVDGMNIRCILDGGHVEFRGKTDRADLPSVLVKALDLLNLGEHTNQVFPDGAILCGEGYGGKIQKGSKYRIDQSFVLFDVWCGEMWLQREDVEDIAFKLGLEIVPIIGKGTLTDLVEMGRSGFDSTWGDFKAEGVVARPATELRMRRGDRCITKIKYKDFRP